jgi:hypothetical protein
VSRPPPTPEKIASWEQQAQALLGERTSEEKVLAHLKHIGCPAPLAMDIVKRSRRPAKKHLRKKGIGIALTGLAILAGLLLLSILQVLIGMPIPMPINMIWFFFIGSGMVVYGILQMLFG